MAVAKKTKPALWARAKAQAKAKMGGKHSARAMQLATKIYKKAGGGYRGSKSSSNKLSKWGKQKWQTSSGKKSEGKRRYLPKKAWKALTAKEKSATNAAKARGNKKENNSLNNQEVSQRKLRDLDEEIYR